MRFDAKESDSQITESSKCLKKLQEEDVLALVILFLNLCNFMK